MDNKLNSYRAVYLLQSTRVHAKDEKSAHLKATTALRVPKNQRHLIVITEVK